MPMMVGGSFRPLETNSSGSVGRLLQQNPISTNPIDFHPPKVVIICNLRHSLVKSVEISCRFDEISSYLAKFRPNPIKFWLNLLPDFDQDQPPPDAYLTNLT